MQQSLKNQLSFLVLKQQFDLHKFVIASEKIQTSTPYSHLGYLMDRITIRAQKVQIRQDAIKTLSDMQKLLDKTGLDPK